MKISKISGALLSDQTVMVPYKESLEILTDLIDDNEIMAQIKQLHATDPKQSFTPINHEGRWIIPVSCGHLTNYQKLRKQFQRLSNQWKSYFGEEVVIMLDQFSKAEADAIINGIYTGSYQIGKYKSSQADQKSIKRLHILNEILSDSDIVDIVNMAATQCDIMDLVNGPANKSNIDEIIRWAKSSGKKYNYNVKVIDTETLMSLGLNALLSVGRASPTPSKMLIMEYDGSNDANKKTIALVGKGITFDTGGVSIKAANNMHYMKSDMGGAAAVLGAIESCASARVQHKVIGLVPLAENVIAGNALLPGDIITSYSGKTIEVIDTDAEGRLILADALYYGQKYYKPDILIDLATLTGSAVRTFGYQCGALFSNNEGLLDQLRTIGEHCGERLWPLPLWEEYAEDLYSDVADVRNLGPLPLAGCIFAAKFLQNFIDDHPAWAHLDIAGVAFGQSEMSKQKSATAYGVKLLYEFICSL